MKNSGIKRGREKESEKGGVRKQGRRTEVVDYLERGEREIGRGREREN